MRGRLLTYFSWRERQRLRDIWRFLKQGGTRQELDAESLDLLRHYERLKRAARVRHLSQDWRTNDEYQAWLRANRLPLRPFDKKLYMRWYRQKKRIE